MKLFLIRHGTTKGNREKRYVGRTDETLLAEYRNFQELDGNPFYQQFIDSSGECGFPDGEDRKTFQKRCVEGFEELMRREVFCQLSCAALVVHGGTIMALLDCYSVPHKNYYEWQTGNGTGFVTEVIRDRETGQWQFKEIKIIK